RGGVVVVAKLKNDNRRMRYGYFALVKALSTINAPILLGLAGVAPGLVPLLYGSRWQPAVPLVQLLAGVGFLRSVIKPSGYLLLATGRVDLGFIWASAVVSAQVIGVSLSVYSFGAVGAAVALVFLHLVYLIALYPFVVRVLVGPCLSSYISSILPAALAGGTMAAAMWVLARLFSAPTPVLLTTQILFGMVIYIGLSV